MIFLQTIHTIFNSLLICVYIYIALRSERVHNARHQNTYLPSQTKNIFQKVNDLVLLPLLQEIWKDKMKGLIC